MAWVRIPSMDCSSFMAVRTLTLGYSISMADRMCFLGGMGLLAASSHIIFGVQIDVGCGRNFPLDCMYGRAWVRISSMDCSSFMAIRTLTLGCSISMADRMCFLGCTANLAVVALFLWVAEKAGLPDRTIFLGCSLSLACVRTLLVGYSTFRAFARYLWVAPQTWLWSHFFFGLQRKQGCRIAPIFRATYILWLTFAVVFWV